MSEKKGKVRTSLSLTEEAQSRAKALAQRLGYDSVSEYIEYLILRDAQEQRPHIVVRDESGVRYGEQPSSGEEDESEKPED